MTPLATPNHQPTPDQLTVVGLRDEVVEQLGYRPGHDYIESVWLGILGPSATWAWQRLARLANTKDGAAVTVDVVDLAVSLGLGEGLGQHAVITRTLGRLVQFGAAKRNGSILGVCLALPPLPERMAGRLSYSARLAHEHHTRRAR